ncbi:hypothetical protein F511_41106 [Dorcoceras hygrometricum]|uniref:Uncharacterized protein n=1 Tax=Dorcoceras hygrometricum TaxID=472368 RepID=A0A2Z7C818_9LAMI|nr:hypothetical protein F511_41106 [Dorcoceras hygrometricum]
MVVDLIGIYGLKGPYCTLTTTIWFLQELSMIPRGSCGDVAKRFYHDPLGSLAAAASCRRKIVSGQLDEENPIVQISSGLLVQANEGIPYPVVDQIDDIYRRLPRSAVFFTKPNRNEENRHRPHAVSRGDRPRWSCDAAATCASVAPLVGRRSSRGGLLGRDAGWRRWRMRYTAAGRPMCAERRFLRAAVSHAWRDVARCCRAIFRVAPPLRRSSGDVVTADFF